MGTRDFRLFIKGFSPSLLNLVSKFILLSPYSSGSELEWQTILFFK